MSNDASKAQRKSAEPKAGDRFVRLEDGDMHVVEDGRPDTPAVLLIHGSAASLATWDLLVPSLAGAFRVVRVDLLGCGKSTVPAGGTTSPPRPEESEPRWTNSG